MLKCVSLVILYYMALSIIYSAKIYEHAVTVYVYLVGLNSCLQILLNGLIPTFKRNKRKDIVQIYSAMKVKS